MNDEFDSGEYDPMDYQEAYVITCLLKAIRPELEEGGAFEYLLDFISEHDGLDRETAQEVGAALRGPEFTLVSKEIH